MNLKDLFCCRNKVEHVIARNEERRKVDLKKNNDNQVLERVYRIEQNIFEKRTQETIDCMKKYISRDESLNVLLSRISKDRKLLAKFDKDKHAFGQSREEELTTIVSVSRYRSYGFETYKDLNEGYKNKDINIDLVSIKNPFKNLDNKIQIEYYKKFVLYHTEKNKVSNKEIKIPLTQFYFAKGEGIPMTTIGMLLPDEELNIKYVKRHISASRTNNRKSPYRNGGIYLADKRNMFKGFVLKSKAQNTVNMWQLRHTLPEYIPELMKIAENTFNEYKNELDAKQYDNAVDKTAKLVWLIANICIFSRGSCWATEVLATSMLGNIPKYKNINMIRSQVDFLAFGNSLDNFKKKFMELIKEKNINKDIQLEILKSL